MVNFLFWASWIIAERALEPLEDLQETFVEVSPVKLNEALQALATLKPVYEEQPNLIFGGSGFQPNAQDSWKEAF